MGEHRRWRPSCLTVEMPARKIGGNSGRAGWEDQGKPQRLTFSGLCRSWADVGLHALGQALFRVLEMLH